jgi:hypothetical protein
MRSLEEKHFLKKPLITSVVMQGKALLQGNYCVVGTRRSHNNSLKAELYPTLAALAISLGRKW